MESEKMHIHDYYKKTIGDKEIIIKPQKSWKYIQEANKGNEDLIAFSEDDKVVTYAEMYEQWDEVARVLSGLDIYRENNSRILILMPNLAKTGMIDYGSDITGAIGDYIDPTTSYEKIRKYIETEKITDIFSLDLLFAQSIGNKVEELKKDYNLKNIIIYKDFYMNSLMPYKLKLVSSALSVINKFSKYVIRYEDAVKNTKKTQIRYDSIDGSQLDFITHTSGTTTGLGKPVPLTDHNRNSLVNEYKLAGYDWPKGLKMLHFIPYFAGYGIVNTAHLGLANGCELQQIPLFSPDKFAMYLINYKPNVVVATTPCWMNLVNNPKYANVDLSFLKIAATGGSPTSMEDEIKINIFFYSHGSDAKLMIGYGMSELSGCAITSVNGFDKKIGSTGVPLPGVDVKFRDNKTGKITDYLVPNSEGEALIHSETMTKGILDNNQIVKTVKIDGKDFIATKDIMKTDEFGNFYYIGRVDGMFQRYDGYNVYPNSIESLLMTYDEINDCSLVWENDETRNGKVPKVFIELNTEVEINDKESFVKEIIDDSFLSHKHESKYEANFRDIPHVWVFIDKMPKNTMQKTDLHKLLSYDIDGDVYKLIVDEDNMSLKNYEVKREKTYSIR